ncbi:unnamed protein product [Closterium sp. NIES-53]
MASLSVLTFDHEGRLIQFDKWLDDLQLYLLSDSRDSVSLFDHTSGATLAPPATADNATRSHWLTLARYSSPATTALGRLILPYLFPELSAFATVEDLISHLRNGAAGAGGPAAGGTGAGGAGATTHGGAGVSVGAGGTGGAGAAGPGGARTRGTGAAGASAGGTGAGGPRAGGPAAGGTQAGGAAATSHGGARVTDGAGGPGGAGAEGPGGARTRGTGAAGAGGVGGIGAGDPGVGGAGAGGAGVGGAGAGGPGAGARDLGAGGAGVGGARAGGTGAGGTVQQRPFFVPPPPSSLTPPDSVLRQVLSLPSSTGLTPCLLCPLPHQSQPQLQPVSPLPDPSPYAKQIDSLTERREPVSRPALPVRAVRTGLRVPRPRPPPVPDTHIMALHPSSVPMQVPLPSPHASSLPDGPDLESGLVRAASPAVTRLLAAVVTDPSFESTAASALVAELVDFAAACCLDYANSLVAESESDCPPSVGGECAFGTVVLEDRQEEFECLAAAVPHLVAMLLAPEGDLDAPDIPTPRSYAEAITGPFTSQWKTAMDAEMASWKSTGTYVDAVPPPRANTVDGMWIFRVHYRFSFRYFSPLSTPLPTSHSLSDLPLDKSVELTGPYPKLVGCLMYLMCCTRPDLAYHLSILARYVAPGRHRLEHREAAKRVLRYLCSTSGMGLVLRGRGPVVLTGHADASWVDDSATQRTSQGYTFNLGSGSVS